MRRFATTLPRDDRDDRRAVHALLPYLWRYRGRALLALACLVLAKLAGVGVPLALKEIVDHFEAGDAGSLALPVTLFLAYGALRMASSAFNELRDAVFARVRHGAMREASERVLRHLHRLSLRYHLERRTGGLSRDIERGTRSISTLLNYMAFSVLPVLAEFALVAVILLGKYSAWYTLITFGAVAVYVVSTFFITRWRMPFRARMNALDSQANARAVDSLINFETVKYFGNEALELDHYHRQLHDWEDAAVQSQTSLSLLNAVQGAVIAAAVTAVMLLAGSGVARGELTLGDLVLVNALLLQLFLPLNFLGIVYSQLQHALSDLDSMLRLLEREPEIEDRPGALPLRLQTGEVRFAAVDFAYQPERPILHGIDLAIPPGHKVAVIGPSGAGKSTLARLLFRFYDVTGGAITLDGQDLREVTQASLRAAIGIVPQDTVLFNDTLYYNIAYGNPAADRAAVERAASLAHLDRFIRGLPDGYETLVGERGLKLSGGEKQRVAIARALLKDPLVMVFDEATSSLDSESERSILEALGTAAERRTTLVIAHRLSTVVDADQILVLDEGRIIERGRHPELLAADGLYATLWRLQQEERAALTAAD
ncbi:MAG TPA: ABC transporter ATP-binding protein/permease [Gammaproteobacteria bacterium]